MLKNEINSIEFANVTFYYGNKKILDDFNLSKMLVTKEIEIDMAHRVPNHKSKCSNLHGHRYRIEVGVDDKVIDEKGVSSEGMVIDFSDLKDSMISCIDVPYDHNAVFYEQDQMRVLLASIDVLQKKQIHYVSFIPTAENLARHWYQILEYSLKQRGVKIKHVKVWETPTSTATYEKK